MLDPLSLASIPGSGLAWRACISWSSSYTSAQQSESSLQVEVTASGASPATNASGVV
jgi:hypothetical protein